MDRDMRVDHDADQYDETVVDPATGDLIRDCHEPLSQHRGRGSANDRSEKTLETGMNPRPNPKSDGT
jgi:hypothetical protein